MDIRKLPLSLVHPSPMNPRKTFDQEGLEELAANIEKQGLLQPITVRPTLVENSDEIHYEIVCGERRYRAMSLLSEKWKDMDSVAPKGESYNRFSEISAIVREMSDAEAFDAMITENLQRKDVDPIEEAFAFGQLIERGDTAEEVALRFGKSIRFVQDRVKLNALIPELMLAIRDGKMPISAGMIISKLDEEQQREFYKQYGKADCMTKFNADNFVNRMFMTLRYAPWMNGGEPGFEGSCGKRCAQCLLNTANHGCLFYEMKGDEIGKCTDQEKYSAKCLDYAIHTVEVNDSRLVKAGESLIQGKMVVGVDIPSWMNDSQRVPLDKMAEEIKSLGYEVVNPSEYFGGQCFYREGDERIDEKLESGECYKVLSLFQHVNVSPRELAYYVKKNDTSTNCADDGTPRQVKDLIAEYNRSTDVEAALLLDGCKAMMGIKPTINALSDVEKKALCQLFLHFGKKLRKEFGLNEMSGRDEVKDMIDGRTDLDLLFNTCLRGYLQYHITSLQNPITYELAKYLPDLGKQWCEDEYKKSQDDVLKKRDKKLAKITKQLADLGYSPSGKKLIKPNTPPPEELKKQYEEMKQKHPDAILLFRVGDFYEIFGENAMAASKVLGLTLTKRADGTELCGFPHHALDTYLPKMVRAGLRAAICEQFEDPKK